MSNSIDVLVSKEDDEAIKNLLNEDARREEKINAVFNPITGEGSVGEREVVDICDFPITHQYLPKSMMSVKLIKKILEYGSIKSFITDYLHSEYNEAEARKVIKQIVKVRCKHDFCFWAAMFVYIKNKDGGEDILFRINRPQRKLLSKFEEMRLSGCPIRVIVLKARQWGGSTLTQIYMTWLQLLHKVGLNSLIVGHVKDASIEVKDMFDKLIKNYPVEMLHEIGEPYSNMEKKIVGVGLSGNIHRIPQRNCKIKIGTAEKPDSTRGGDYSLVHCTEVGLWTLTEGKRPEDIVRSACSGVLLRPYTMIVYESTANGCGNFFHREYTAAKRDVTGQFDTVFVAWYEIDLYRLDVADKYAFAKNLWINRENDYCESDREENGKYLWYLWENGATLEAINWYINERKKYNDHADMAREFPSDDIEPFVHSGNIVFDKYRVEKFRKFCKSPKYIGDIYGNAMNGEEALKRVRFKKDNQGSLCVWSLPDIDEEERVLNRYLVVVDIGGRSNKADWSVICVFDRLNMMDDGKPVVVAQWYGHIDMDLLAWKSAQIAKFYDNALLVIESNTLETHDKERQIDGGDNSGYILNQIRDYYDNLYARRQSEEEIRNREPKKYGFHTNVSTKPKVINTLIMSIREQLYVERDERCLDEYNTYERKPNGAYGAILGMHDDLLMTRAIGLHICFYEMPIPCIVKQCAKKTKRKNVVSAATI